MILVFGVLGVFPFCDFGVFWVVILEFYSGRFFLSAVDSAQKDDSAGYCLWNFHFGGFYLCGFYICGVPLLRFSILWFSLLWVPHCGFPLLFRGVCI